MAYVSKNTATVYVTEEVTEGTAVAPSAGDFVSINDAFEINGEKELVERNNLSSSLIKELPRTGIKTATVSLPVEAKANVVEGVAPEAGSLFKAALGGSRSNTNSVTTITTTNVSVIPVSSVANLAAGDFVMIKDSNITGGYHISPLSAVALNGTNDDTMTLVVDSPTAPTNGSSLAKFTTYYTANSGHPSLTVSTYLEDALELQAAGCRVSSLSMSGFETGQIANFEFSMTGMGYSETVSASGLTPTRDAATPPLVLSACVYKNGVAIPVNSFAFTVANTLERITSTCSANGILAHKVTQTVITGSFDPYMDTTSVALFDEFNDGDEVSLVAVLKNPGASAGVFKEAIGVYIPRCIITSANHTDSNGLMKYSIEFSAGVPTSGPALSIGFM